ncbi:MAG: IS1595 family transposase [Candidatus Manganitrophus sp. SA1]|nr:IS1595 family transposase [Candidatus Manganitrophus morganii]
MNLVDIGKHFNDADSAREFLEDMRWRDGVICPHCGIVGEAYRLTPKGSTKTRVRKGVWKCKGCRKQFTVTVGTIFEDSHIPLHKWLLAIHLLCSSKKGMSAHQLHRLLDITYKSAWFMAHRIRYAMSQEPLTSKLQGTIEVDETYIGGKIRASAHRTKPGERPKDYPNPFANKAAVVSVLQRGGRVQSVHVEKVTAENLKPVIKQMVAENAHLMTDSSSVLISAGSERKHDQVNHSIDEYVRYEDGVCITTNGVEGYFANLKRGIKGVYHHVGKQHLHRYLAEFDFRYNARKIKDGERTLEAIKGVEGKRLKLKD